MQEVGREFRIPVISISNLDDLFGYLSGAGADPQLQSSLTVPITKHSK